MLSMQRREEHEREFEVRFLRAHGLAFQELFADIMERAFRSDFLRVRSHGQTGDMKCDGYLYSQKAVFQVYAPEDMRRLGRLLEKIGDDFEGAQAKWSGRIERWV